MLREECVNHCLFHTGTESQSLQSPLFLTNSKEQYPK